MARRTFSRLRGPGLLLAALVVTAGAITLTATGTPANSFRHPHGPVYEFFAAQTGVQCEMASGGWAKTGWTYCQTVTPPRSVRLTTSSRASVCTGDGCLGNPGIGTPRVPIGTTVVLGPYACSVESHGVRCSVDVVTGFRITPGGVRRF